MEDLLKKSVPALNSLSARAMIAVIAIMLVGEFLVLLLADSIHTTILVGVLLKRWLFDIALTAIVALASYRLIFKPMSTKQAELEWQRDELRLIQKMVLGLELGMKGLAEQIATPCNSLSIENADDIPLTVCSLEKPHHASEQSNTQPLEKRQCSAKTP